MYIDYESKTFLLTEICPGISRLTTLSSNNDTRHGHIVRHRVTLWYFTLMAAMLSQEAEYSPGTSEITAVRIETYHNDDYIYLQTRPLTTDVSSTVSSGGVSSDSGVSSVVSSITRLCPSGGVLCRFGLGTGGLAIDTGTERDCVCSGHNDTITRYYRNGTPINMWHPATLPVDGAETIVSIMCFTRGCDTMYAVVDEGAGSIIIMTYTGAVTQRIRPRDGDVFTPRYLAPTLAPSNTLATTGYHSNQVRLYSLRGDLVDCIEDEMTEPRGLCVDTKGRLIVCYHGDGTVVRVTKLFNWHKEVLLTPEVLGDRRPCHVDVSDRGHLVVSVESRDQVNHWVLVFSGYQ